ncbi:MAG: FAD-dependent oxidoreductase [Opitutaceae bacterium]
MSALHFDLVVIGAGSGGFGAAFAAARLGVKTLLLEKSDWLGGNATRCGVNTWETGVGGTGVPFDLYKRLKKIPQAVGIYTINRHICWADPADGPGFPGAELLIDPTKRYLDTLRQFGAPEDYGERVFRQTHWHGVPFEPAIYAAEMERMLAETGCCTVWRETAFTHVDVSDRRIRRLTLSNGETVTADFFIDATADILVAQAAGCATSLGREPRSLYDEPSAPREPTNQLNGATLIYRVTPTDRPGIEPLPDDIPQKCWWNDRFPGASCNQYPNGDFNINSLPTMPGREVVELGYKAAYAECLRRIKAHWHHTQTVFPEFQAYRMTWVAPGLGVREGPRLLGRHVLTEHDLDAGLTGQTHEDIITIADHCKDTHGADVHHRDRNLKQPYGVPFRCLLPREIDNLAVACRGASLSSIAASSCRLSRTMMQLGQAAGTGVALAKTSGVSSLADVPSRNLRACLAAQHVELTWPRSPELIAHLQAE